MPYSFEEHTADVKFTAEGKTLEETFIEATKALNETIYGKIRILEQRSIKVEIEGTDLENLLYKFLEEILFLLDSENFVVGSVKDLEIYSETKKLTATLWGDNAENYAFTNDVKAVTYNDMKIELQDGKWKIKVVLDV